jgi:hypothetical protein
VRRAHQRALRVLGVAVRLKPSVSRSSLSPWFTTSASVRERSRRRFPVDAQITVQRLMHEGNARRLSRRRWRCDVGYAICDPLPMWHKSGHEVEGNRARIAEQRSDLRRGPGTLSRAGGLHSVQRLCAIRRAGGSRRRSFRDQPCNYAERNDHREERTAPQRLAATDSRALTAPASLVAAADQLGTPKRRWSFLVSH